MGIRFNNTTLKSSGKLKFKRKIKSIGDLLFKSSNINSHFNVHTNKVNSVINNSFVITDLEPVDNTIYSSGEFNSYGIEMSQNIDDSFVITDLEPVDNTIYNSGEFNSYAIGMSQSIDDSFVITDLEPTYNKLFDDGIEFTEN